MHHKLFPYLALATGIAALSMSAMFVRWANAPGAVTGFYRVLFSSILMFPIFLHQQKQRAPLDKKFLYFPLAAGIFTALDFAFWNSSVHYTTAANATLLGNTAPLWVALAAWLIFREKLRGSFWLGLVFTLTGAALIVGGDFWLQPTFGFGDLLASAAAVFYASYQLVTQRGRAHIDPLRYTWLVSLSATFGLLIINLMLGNPLTGYPAQSWLIFFITAVVSQMIGYLAISYALGHLPAAVVSPTLVGQPLLTAILAIPLLGEIPSRAQWLGGALALAGIYIVNQSHTPTPEETPNA